MKESEVEAKRTSGEANCLSCGHPIPLHILTGCIDCDCAIGHQDASEKQSLAREADRVLLARNFLKEKNRCAQITMQGICVAKDGHDGPCQVEKISKVIPF